MTTLYGLCNIAGPLVPYNHACHKRGLIHRDRESSIIRPLLYLQATTAGFSTESNKKIVFEQVIKPFFYFTDGIESPDVAWLFNPHPPTPTPNPQPPEFFDTQFWLLNFRCLILVFQFFAALL